MYDTMLVVIDSVPTLSPLLHAYLGAKALGGSLFGHANRWGKLPVTMYPKDYLSKLPPMGKHTGTSYSMAAPPGRS